MLCSEFVVTSFASKVSCQKGADHYRTWSFCKRCQRPCELGQASAGVQLLSTCAWSSSQLLLIHCAPAAVLPDLLVQLLGDPDTGN